MFITTRNHLAAIKEIRTYWSNQLDNANQEVRRLKTENAFLRASLRVARAPEPLPAPLPAAREPKAVIVHLLTYDTHKTVCGQPTLSLMQPRKNVMHQFSRNRKITLQGNESWCADCLG